MKKILNQDKFKKIISIIVLILWCILIFYLSNRNGTLSGNDSLVVVNFLGDFGLKLESILGINITYLIRKLAHIYLYFVLYIFAFNSLNNFNFKKKNIISFLFSFFYAISDEIHQMFILERSASIIDIFIDTLGIILGFLFLKIVYFLILKGKKKEKKVIL